MTRLPKTEREHRHDLKVARTKLLRLVPESGDVDDLIGRVAEDRGRQITLTSYPFSADSGITGVWIATDRGDYIGYADNASPSERCAIICHELAHIVLSHDLSCDNAEILALLAPHIAPEVSQMFLGRCGYEKQAELMAETLATQLVTKLVQRSKVRVSDFDRISVRMR